MSFFLGSWRMNFSAQQPKQSKTALRFTRFLSRATIHSPWTQKKDIHSLNEFSTVSPVICQNKIYWFIQLYFQNSRGVCETLQYAPSRNKVEKAIFSFKVKVKVTRSLTLVSFERASLVEYACQIWSLYLLRFKSYSEG